MIADDRPRLLEPWRFFAELRKLDQQTVAQIFCSHAYRIETLDALQNGFDFLKLNLVVAHAFQYIVEGDGQIAGVVNGIDN